MAFLIALKHCIPASELVPFLSVMSLPIAHIAWPPIFSVGLRNISPRMN